MRRDKSTKNRLGLKNCSHLPSLHRRPAHIVTFLAPKDKNPNFATFKVPLTFNKFDMRDYLLHAYRTPVVAVRSQLRQRPPKNRGNNGRLYRPPPIKTMTVQLAQPFVWPSAPTDVKPWKQANVAKAGKQQKLVEKYKETMMTKAIAPLRDERPEPEARKNMREEAKRLLNEGGWTNKRDVDPRFSETKKR